MATQVQWRGGSTAEHATFTGAAREVTVDTQKQTLVVHNGSTAGGEALLREDQANLPGSVTNGIYTPGTNQVAVSTGGTGRVFVDASGNVGVGVAPASYAGYSVIGHGSTTGATLEQRVNGSLVGSLTADSQVTLKASTAIPIVFGTNNTERLRITSAGLVGIGTSVPGESLTVANGALQISGILSSLNRPSSAVMDFQSATGLTRFFSIGSDASTQGLFSFCTATTTTYIERLRIDQNGNVGIGTTSPSQKLEIGGAGRSTLVVGSTNSFAELSLNGTAAENYLSSNSPLAVSVNSAERLRFDAAGRILVGVSSALYGSTAKLQCATTANITTTAYADNAAAKAGGLVVGDIYRKADGTLMITF